MIEMREQLNLPGNLKDDKKQRRITMNILELQIKLRNIVWQEVINSEILVVYCGTHIQFALIKDVDFHLHQ